MAAKFLATPAVMPICHPCSFIVESEVDHRLERAVYRKILVKENAYISFVRAMKTYLSPGEKPFKKQPRSWILVNL